MPPPTTGLVAWYEADVGVYTDLAGTVPATTNGDVVALWKDQSGNGHDASQSNAALRPNYQTNVFNGKPTVMWANSDGSFGGAISLDTASISHNIGTGDFLFAAVHRLKLDGGYKSLLSNGSFNPAWYLKQNTGVQAEFYFGGDHQGSVTYTQNVAYLTEMVRVSGTVKYYLSSGGAAPAQDPTTFSISTSISNAVFHLGNDASNDGWYGDIAEIFLYSASLSGGDQTALEQYLRNKYWGVSFATNNASILLSM